MLSIAFTKPLLFLQGKLLLLFLEFELSIRSSIFDDHDILIREYEICYSIDKSSHICNRLLTNVHFIFVIGDQLLFTTITKKMSSTRSSDGDM